MRKITTFVLAAFIALSVTFISAPNATASPNLVGQEKVIYKTKRGAKKVWYKGRWVASRSFHNGKKITKKVWYKGKWVAVKTGRGVKRFFRKAKNAM